MRLNADSMRSGFQHFYKEKYNRLQLRINHDCRYKKMNDSSQLYEQDYARWAQKQIELLRSGRFSDIDIEHLVEELRDMGKSERDELENRLTILLAHLLKWQFQYQQLSERWKEFDGRSWRYTIIEQRDRIARRLRKSPGLKSKLDMILPEAYADAMVLAVKETGLPEQTFPPHCPYTQEDILDNDYYPVS